MNRPIAAAEDEFASTRLASARRIIAAGAESERRANLRGILSADFGYASVKPVLEFILAIVLLILTAPLILTTMAIVKLTSAGPAIYSQTRLGRHGRHFTIYKIRTMVHDCERTTGPLWSGPGDSRITRIGHFLRFTHIDELPQLWNVIKGDMSLIGPRPERPKIAADLTRSNPCYERRLQVRPGVTGLAQIQLPPDQEVSDVERKLICDLHYIRHSGFWLDLRILIATGFGVLGFPFEKTRGLLRIPAVEDCDPIDGD